MRVHTTETQDAESLVPVAKNGGSTHNTIVTAANRTHSMEKLAVVNECSRLVKRSSLTVHENPHPEKSSRIACKPHG